MSDIGKRQRKRYDDKFRASAVIMLEAAGYPGRDGALTQTAQHLGVALNTLKGWFTAQHNPPPAELRNKKRGELIDWIKEELSEVFLEMDRARPDASYRDLGTVGGILIDKLQLLEGKPTWRVEIVDLLKSGAITPQDVLDEFSDAPELAQELFESAGIHFAKNGEDKAQADQ